MEQITKHVEGQNDDEETDLPPSSVGKGASYLSTLFP